MSDPIYVVGTAVGTALIGVSWHEAYLPIV